MAHCPRGGLDTGYFGFLRGEFVLLFARVGSRACLNGYQDSPLTRLRGIVAGGSGC
jgi:hypothetical protein